MRVYKRVELQGEARTLPAKYYTSTEIFERERERIFGTSWLYAGRADEIPNTGDYFLYELFDESLIVLRGADQQIRALYNVCRHRGTRMCETGNGKFTGAIQCPYHAWTYSLDGRLMAARNMQGADGFDKNDWPLAQAHLAQWEGFLFVSFADKPEPFSVAFASLEKRFEKWHIAGLRSAKRYTYELRCNWKLVAQNYSECYHCPVIHPQLDKLSPWDSGRNDLGEGPFLGGFMTLRTPGGSMTLDGHTSRPPVGDVRGDDLDRIYYYSVFPTMLLSLHPDYVMAHRLVPLGVDRVRVDCDWLFDPATMARPDFDASDAIGFWDMTNKQDWKVCELSQAGIQSRAYTPGPYSPNEGILQAFDKHYLSVIGP
jgi:phenylpropionate dioxygenase-like ring-hydroxylating dioxygenase large terminal subunit